MKRKQPMGVASRVNIILYVLSILLLCVAGYRVYDRFSAGQAQKADVEEYQGKYTTLCAKRTTLQTEIEHYEDLYVEQQKKTESDRETLIEEAQDERQRYIDSIPDLYTARDPGDAVCEYMTVLSGDTSDATALRQTVISMGRYFASSENVSELVSFTKGGTWKFWDVTASYDAFPVCWTQHTDDGHLAVVYFANYNVENENFSKKHRVLLNYPGFINSLTSDIEHAP